MAFIASATEQLGRLVLVLATSGAARATANARRGIDEQRMLVESVEAALARIPPSARVPAPSAAA